MTRNTARSPLSIVLVCSLLSMLFLGASLATDAPPAPRSPRAVAAPEAVPAPEAPRVPSVRPFIFVGDDGDDVDVRYLAGWSGSYLGVNVVGLTKELCAHYGINQEGAVLIGRITEDSPAETAGLRVGDIITSIDNKEINNARELQRQIARREADEIVLVEIYRDRELQTIQATLAERDKVQVKLNRFLENWQVPEMPEMPEMPELPETLENYKFNRVFPGDAYNDAIKEALESIREGDVFEKLKQAESERQKEHDQRMKDLERRHREVEERLKELEKRIRERSSAPSAGTSSSS